MVMIYHLNRCQQQREFEHFNTTLLHVFKLVLTLRSVKHDSCNHMTDETLSLACKYELSLSTWWACFWIAVIQSWQKLSPHQSDSQPPCYRVEDYIFKIKRLTKFGGSAPHIEKMPLLKTTYHGFVPIFDCDRLCLKISTVRSVLW